MANWPPFHRLCLSEPLKLNLGITAPVGLASGVTLVHNWPPSTVPASLASLVTIVYNNLPLRNQLLIVCIDKMRLVIDYSTDKVQLIINCLCWQFAINY